MLSGEKGSSLQEIRGLVVPAIYFLQETRGVVLPAIIFLQETRGRVTCDLFVFQETRAVVLHIIHFLQGAPSKVPDLIRASLRQLSKQE